MNKQQYESLSEDLKLDARLAIALDKDIHISAGHHLFTVGGWTNSSGQVINTKSWQPRQDPAILLGLIGCNLVTCLSHTRRGWVTEFGYSQADMRLEKTKEEAIIAAYCHADPHGHWAKWCKDNGVIV
jgi:hypothetical protein